LKVTVLEKYMAKEKTNWDDIPSLDDLSVDWSFEPENPLGRRKHVRICQKDLHAIIGVKNIPLKVVAKNIEAKGSLVDLNEYGMAALLETKFVVEQSIKVGLFLGENKIISKAIVRNVNEIGGKFRTGIEFVELEKEYETAIAAIVASKNFKSL
jgi:c-di-GMP-binding flagellar brake protein YcgR